MMHRLMSLVAVVSVVLLGLAALGECPAANFRGSGFPGISGSSTC